METDLIPRAVRAWIYRAVLIAQLALAYGILGADVADDVERWLMFVSAVLGVGTAGMATRYTPRGTSEGN